VSSLAGAPRMPAALRLVVVVLAASLVFLPIYFMVVIAFSPRSDVFDRDLHLVPSTWTLDNFRELFEDYPVWLWMGNSFTIALITTVLTVALNLAAGYAFAKTRFRGDSVLFLLLLSTLMIPLQAVVIPQFRLVSEIGIYGTFWAVILPGAASAFGIFLSRQFMTAIPDELLEAGRIDGASNLQIFTRIVLPLCRPLIAVLTLLTFMYHWNDFLWPLIALKERELFTLPLALGYLNGQYETNYGGVMAATLVSSLPMLLLFLLFQRFFVQGFARSGIR
jgi:ABC-type glycerol-3-phosphate transport system permease component